MKIGIDAHVIGKGVGGVERFVYELVLRLPDITPENDYIIFLNSQEYRQHRLPLYPNVTYVRLASSNPLLERLLVMPWLCYRYSLDALFVQRLLPWCCGRTKYVVAIHDLTPIKFPQAYSGLTNRLVRLLTANSVRRAQLILTPTMAISNEIKRFYGTTKALIHPFYNGVDVQKFKPSATPKSLTHLNVIKPYILTTGAIERRKNIETLYHAMSKFDPARLLQLVVVGGVRDLEYAQELQTILRSLGLQDKVIHLGYLSEDDLIALYQQAEVFITASRDEGFNLPPLEAMACGTPVICSNIAVHAELFDRCAHFFETESSDALVDAIKTLLSDKSISKQLKIEAQQRVKQYTWDATALRIAQSFKALKL